MAAWAVVLVLPLLVCWLGADSARALVVQLPNGQVAGITPRAGVAPASIPGARTHHGQPLADNGTMNYHNGPVLHSSAPYLIFWGPAGSIPPQTRALMIRYFADVAHDSGSATNVYGVVRQYTDAIGFADYRQTFSSAQVLNDTNPYPPPDATNCVNSVPAVETTCVTAAQLQGELSNFIAVHSLPTDGSNSGSLVPNAPIYFLVTPASVNICSIGPVGGKRAQCADNAFCAYHSSYLNGVHNNILYASIPLLNALVSHPPNLDPKLCQADGYKPIQEPNSPSPPNAPDSSDVAINYMSHENAETITDPLITGWWDSISGNEIGDNCNATGPIDFTPGASTDPYAFQPTLGGSPGAAPGTGTLFDQTINAASYYTQSEWSNGTINCEMRPAPANLTPAFTIPSGAPAVGSPVSFDPSSGAPPAGYSSVTWSFGDGGIGFAPGTATVPHIYTAAGVYSVTLTAVDTLGNLATATQSVTVRTPPAASFAGPGASPLAGFAASFDASGSSDPNAGGSIIAYDWSFGDGTTDIGVNPLHVYGAPGIYAVQLTVTDSFGLVSAPFSRQVQVLGLPSASFTFSPAAPVSGRPVAFAGSGADPNSTGSISSYAWSFGDGSTGTGATPSHTYASSGTYTVSLKLTDSFGLSTTDSRVITVAAPHKVVPGLPTVSSPQLSLRRARLSFVLTAGKRAPQLARVVIALPNALSFDKKAVRKGLSVTSTRGTRIHFVHKPSHGRLTITLTSPANTVRIRIAGAITGAAVTAARTHRHGGRSHGKVRIVVTAIDTAGTQTSRTLVFPG